MTGHDVIPGKRGVSKMHGCYNAIGLWFVEGVVRIKYRDWS